MSLLQLYGSVLKFLNLPVPRECKMFCNNWKILLADWKRWRVSQTQYVYQFAFFPGITRETFGMLFFFFFLLANYLQVTSRNVFKKHVSMVVLHNYLLNKTFIQLRQLFYLHFCASWCFHPTVYC